MTEFTAEEKYRAFESLRSRFGGSGGSGKTGPDQDYRAQQQIKSKRRAGTRPDPRSNAPPLVPLVEEGDANFDDRSLMKGMWKHSSIIKSNHLNAPDFDALETASVASCSSAYSSKSESSIVSPPCGSVTALSDAGSCDTFQEYDVSSHQKHKILQLRPHHLHVGKLKIDPIGSENEELIKFTSSSPDIEVPDNFVCDHAKLWNKAIGDWRFGGISLVPSSSSPHTLKVTNEVRLPTPVVSPQGSTDNLLDNGSRSSLLSSCDETAPTCDSYRIPDRHYPLGKFVKSRSLSTSSLVSAFQSMSLGEVSHMRSFSGTDILCVDMPMDEREKMWCKTPNKRCVNRKQVGKKAASMERLIASHENISEPVFVEENERQECCVMKEIESTAISGEHERESCVNKEEKTEHEKLSIGKDFSRLKSKEQTTHSSLTSNGMIKVSERIKLLGTLSNLAKGADVNKPSMVYTPPTKSNKWLEAHSKSKALMTTQESQSAEAGRTLTSSRKQKVEEPTTMKVKDRALLFGGTN